MEQIFVKESDIPVTRWRKQFIKTLIMQGGVITYKDLDDIESAILNILNTRNTKINY